jgi:hypothetical protein
MGAPHRMQQARFAVAKGRGASSFVCLPVPHIYTIYSMQGASGLLLACAPRRMTSSVAGRVGDPYVRCLLLLPGAARPHGRFLRCQGKVS